jgi:CHAT domain-containing protein
MKLPNNQFAKPLSLGLFMILGLGISSGIAVAQTSDSSPPPLGHDMSNPTEVGPFLGHDVTNSTENGPPRIDGGSQTVPLSGDAGQMVAQIEINQSSDYANYFGFNLYGENTSADNISKTLGSLAKATGINSALVYVMETPKGLSLTLVLPSTPNNKSASNLLPDWVSLFSFKSPFDRIASLQPQRKLAQQSNPSAPETPNTRPYLITRLVPEAKSSEVKRVLKRFRKEITDPTKTETTSYKIPAKTLYDWIINPLKSDLEANNIETLVFSLDRGLRAMPVAALNDGQEFLIEQYNLALIPSFSLTDTRYQALKGSKMLGMGITQSTGGQSPLPSVAVEVPTLTTKIWQGSGYLDQQSTIEQFKTLTQQERFSIIHLATHALFNPGKVNESYIQFWNERLTLPQLRNISLNQKWTAAPNIEMLVLSACQSALGNDQAELGFTGLAVQSGVKTAVGSLWSVSDEGSLGLMSEFYRALRTAPTRSAALREAQLGLLQGQVKMTDGQLQLKDGTKVVLPNTTAQQKNLSFTHPYYWSAFTMVGNWN